MVSKITLDQGMTLPSRFGEAVAEDGLTARLLNEEASCEVEVNFRLRDRGERRTSLALSIAPAPFFFRVAALLS